TTTVGHGPPSPAAPENRCDGPVAAPSATIRPAAVTISTTLKARQPIVGRSVFAEAATAVTPIATTNRLGAVPVNVSRNAQNNATAHAAEPTRATAKPRCDNNSNERSVSR